MQYKDQCDVIVLWLHGNLYKHTCLTKTVYDTSFTKNFRLSNIKTYKFRVFNAEQKYQYFGQFRTNILNKFLLDFLCFSPNVQIRSIYCKNNHLYWGLWKDPIRAGSEDVLEKFGKLHHGTKHSVCAASSFHHTHQFIFLGAVTREGRIRYHYLHLNLFCVGQGLVPRKRTK